MAIPSLYQTRNDGSLEIRFHRGQYRAWQSTKRHVLVLAGTQSGKTSFGPLWLYREIQRCGPGDYLVVTPTFQLLALKALPEFQRYFIQTLRLGQYVGSPTRYFAFDEAGSIRTFGAYDTETPTRVLFGHAQDPESLESATAKAAWLDEAGQNKFKRGSYEAILRRLSLAQGRVLYTTTAYNLGWLKKQLFDRAGAPDSDIDVVQFDSTENPRFPRAEFERMRRDLPPWKFNMSYRGKFERPAGLIYSSFDEQRHVTPRFALPDHWQRYLGLDFGGVHTAGLFYAEEPNTNKLYLYREYLAGERTAAKHCEALLAGEPMVPVCVGGSASEGQWRSEFRAGGLPVQGPTIKDVEVGINRVYGTHARNEIIVFDDLTGYLEEKQTYSRELDDTGEPTEAIEDKNTFHRLDAERYIIGWLRPADPGGIDDGAYDILTGNVRW